MTKYKPLGTTLKNCDYHSSTALLPLSTTVSSLVFFRHSLLSIYGSAFSLLHYYEQHSLLQPWPSTVFLSPTMAQSSLPFPTIGRHCLTSPTMSQLLSSCPPLALLYGPAVLPTYGPGGTRVLAQNIKGFNT